MIPDQKRSSFRFITRVDAWLNRLYGSRYNPLYQSGAIVVTLLGLLLITGLYLLLFYRLGQPWASVARVTDQVFVGRWIRALHRFASDAIVVAAVVHAFRMYAQRRDWGARALAWVSGLILLFVIFICGWTGYVMVWDTHAQVLAMEGARFLDALPIFSEPISRTFVGERDMPNAFFFLNLFAHVALPIGVGLLLWIHVSRVARPAFLPPRKLFIAVIASVTLLAVVWPLRMAPPADLLRIPHDVPLDLFFGFWLPITRQLRAPTVWAFGTGALLTLALLPWWSRPRADRRPAKSKVNERHCTGCEQCMHDCPYGAISMIPRPDGREGIVARVNADACTACGICIGSCAPMALGPQDQTARDQLAAVRTRVVELKPAATDVVMIGCGWSGAPRAASESRTLLFDVGCAGNLHTSTVEYLVRSGVGGVLIVSCPERDCRGREGVKWLNERLYNGREAELKERVDRRRIRVVEAGAAEVAVVLAALDDFHAEIRQLAESSGEEHVDIVALCERPDVQELAS